MRRDTQCEPAQKKTTRAIVYEYICAQGPVGATDEEIAKGTGLSPNTVRPRRGELEMYGEIHDSGRRATLDSGRLGIVWRA